MGVLPSISQTQNFNVIVMDDEAKIRELCSLFFTKAGMPEEQIIKLANPAQLNKFLKQQEKDRESLRNLCVLSDTDMYTDDYAQTSTAAPTDEEKNGIDQNFKGCQKLLREFSDRFNFYLLNRSARVEIEQQDSQNELSKKGSIENPIRLAKLSDVNGFKDFLRALITHCASEDGPFAKRTQQSS